LGRTEKCDTAAFIISLEIEERERERERKLNRNLGERII
jgi:hypothetical protein